MRDQDQQPTGEPSADVISVDGGRVAVSSDWRGLRDSLRILKDWCGDPDWVASLSFDLAIHPRFEAWAVDRIGAFASAQPTGDDRAADLARLRVDTVKALEVARNAASPLLRWHLYRLAYAHYGFIETVIEASSFSEAVLVRTMAALGDEALTKLAAVDGMNPSALTNFTQRPGRETDRALLGNAAVRDYLTLKAWQDDQHEFHEQVIFPEFQQARREFDEWRAGSLPHLDGFTARDALAAVIVVLHGLVPIAYVARLLQANITPALGAVVGGKALGLARLELAEHAPPSAWVIPVDALLSEGDVQDLTGELWAVRSSATVEDGENSSFAGIFTSELAVTPENLTAAIDRVRASVNAPRVTAYVEQFNTATPHMAVVVQEFKAPSFAGVWLGRDAASGRLEWANGDGEKLVSGHVTPAGEEWTVDQSPTGSLTCGGGAVGELCLNLQQRFGAAVDLEWAIVNNQIRWLQHRPVTTPLPETTPSAAEGPGQLTGIPASAGTVTGPASVIEDPDNAASP
ncbi:MAG: PEP/pyruvate-binding domain-containing protein [Mycobacteriales bacterium]